MNQLQFVAAFLLLTAHVCLAGEGETSKKNYKLLVLHNNDLHSRIDEMDENTAPCPKEYVDNNQCFGGWARIKKAVDEARAKAKTDGTPSIFLNAGDSFQETPYYTVFKTDILIPMIEMLGFDALSLGHHEFDDGIVNLAKFVNGITAPVVCANKAIKEKEKEDEEMPPMPAGLWDKLPPSTVIEVGEGEMKRNICVIGYLNTEATRVKSRPLKFTDEIEAIEKEAQTLKADKTKNCHFIIALGHAGYEKDLKIAAAVKEINMVIGGDSHTFLYTKEDKEEKAPSVEEIAGDYPTIVKVKKLVKGEVQEVKVPVVQAYTAGKYLGILNVEFDEEGHVVEAYGNPRLLDSSVEKDKTVETAVKEWRDKLIEKIPELKKIKGHTRTFLAKPEFDKKQFESTLTNLITDSFFHYAVKLAHERQSDTWTGTPIAFYPTGGIRATLSNKRSRGALTLEDFMHLLPFQNDMFELTVLGSSLRKYLEASVELYDKHAMTFKKTHYIQFAGLRVTYDLAKPKDHRVESAVALCMECAVPEYFPIVDDQSYHIITTRTEFNKFTWKIKAAELKHHQIDGVKDIDLLLSYIEKMEVVGPYLDKRIIVKNFEIGVPKEADESVPMDIVEAKEESSAMDVSGSGSSPGKTGPFHME